MARAARESLLALDTSCLVALVCGWHEHHAPTLRAVEKRMERGEVLLVAAPALVESYSVLTRLPAPHRIAPLDALRLLRDNFHGGARTNALSARDYWSLLDAAPANGVQGGRTYDAVIAACARKAGAHTLLTLNLRHFEAFGDEELKIASPIDA